MTVVADVMTTELCIVSPQQSSRDAAALMRDRGVGDVLVVDHRDHLLGMVTDRDLAVRLLAEGMGPDTPVAELCTLGPVTVVSGAPLHDAVRLMRDNAVRRLPVTDDDDRLVGVVSIGDLAIEADPDSVLADISQSPDNN